MGAALCTSLTGWLTGRWLCGVDWLTSSRNVILAGQGGPVDAVGGDVAAALCCYR